MSKRTYESGSSKRKKTTAKAEAQRVVIEKMEPITQFFAVLEGSTPDMATDLCAFFFWARRRSRTKKFVKSQTWIRSHFSFSAVAGACAVFIGLRSRSRKESAVFGWSRIPNNTTSRRRSQMFFPTPEVKLDHFWHHTPKLGIPVEVVQFHLKLLLKPRLWSRYSNFRLRASKFFGSGSNC